MNIPVGLPFALSIINIGIGVVTIYYIISAQRKLSEGRLRCFVQWVLGGVFFTFMTSFGLARLALIQDPSVNAKIPIFAFIYLSLICFSISIMVLNELSETYGFKKQNSLTSANTAD